MMNQLNFITNNFLHLSTMFGTSCISPIRHGQGTGCVIQAKVKGKFSQRYPRSSPIIWPVLHAQVGWTL